MEDFGEGKQGSKMDPCVLQSQIEATGLLSRSAPLFWKLLCGSDLPITFQLLENICLRSKGPINPLSRLNKHTDLRGEVLMRASNELSVQRHKMFALVCC